MAKAQRQQFKIFRMGNTHFKEGPFKEGPHVHPEEHACSLGQSNRHADTLSSNDKREKVSCLGDERPPLPKKCSFTLVSKIKQSLQSMLDPGEPERLIPIRSPPKVMLYGCTTAEEHFEKVDEVVRKSAKLHGKEGLKFLGLEFRWIHHPTNCDCEGMGGYLTDEEGDDEFLKTSSVSFGQFEDPLDISENDFWSPGETFTVPLKGCDQRSSSGISAGSSNGRADYGSISPNSKTNNISSLPTPRTMSSVSLFSLATHASTISESSGRFPLTSVNARQIDHLEPDTCAFRLFHVESGAVVTHQNHMRFMAEGAMYDEVARLCMEAAQDVMIQEGDLQWITVCPHRNLQALVSKTFLETSPDTNQKRKTLLVITGKGQVRAGIFSRRHLIVNSMESSTALPFVREALKRRMNVVMLDPNAHGCRMGMDVVERSLNALFLKNNQQDDIYVLAHSMAGAQLVRFFIGSSSACTTLATSHKNSKVLTQIVDKNTSDHESRDYSLTVFLKNIQAIAFTDSNHNINWTKSYPYLTELLTGPASLYIKSHKVHEKAKQLGESHHDCQFWKHRFGNVKTLWAGTHEHALTNYTGRIHIWQHFDRLSLDMNLEENPKAN